MTCLSSDLPLCCHPSSLGQVYDGTGPTATLKRRLCDTAPLDVIEASSNVMTVRMVTDISVNGRGFHARYRVGESQVPRQVQSR